MVMSLHPGTTDTDLSVPFQKNVKTDMLFTTEKSCGLMLNVIFGTYIYISTYIYIHTYKYIYIYIHIYVKVLIWSKLESFLRMMGQKLHGRE
jgi:hypothetical protein